MSTTILRDCSKNIPYLVADSSTATGLAYAAPGGGVTFAGVSVKKTATQSLSNTTFTKLTWNSEDYDTDSYHDNSVNNERITIPAGKGGYYSVSGTVSWTNNGTGVRIVQLNKNGVAVEYIVALQAGPASDFTTLPFSFVVNLAATDFLELFGYQSSGGALNVIISSRFQVSFLGA